MLNHLRRLFISDKKYLSDNIIDIVNSFEEIIAVYKGNCSEDYKKKSTVYYFLHQGKFNDTLEDAITDLDLKIARNTNIKCSFASWPSVDTELYPHLGKPVYFVLPEKSNRLYEYY